MAKVQRWADYDGTCPSHPHRQLHYTRSRRQAVCEDCDFFVDTGEIVDIPDLPPDPPKEETVPLPQCQYECKMPATYDFVTAEELWAYGCTLHWMKHRRTKQLGPGHGQHLTDGRALPERDPNARIFATPDGPLPDPTRRHRASPQPRSAPRPRSLKEFHDMEPSPDGQKQPKAGVQLVALELGRGEGFTMAELQAKLDETTRPGAHDALKLMTFMHTDRGWGWKQGEDGRIRVQP